MIFLSTSLFLASSCLLVHAEMVTSCKEDLVHRLSCVLGKVINVQTALYGREDNVTCSEGKSPAEVSTIDCSFDGVTDHLQRRCNGKNICELSANVFVGQDPCRGTAKYLQTTYICLPVFHTVTCEESLLHISCDEGQVIVVYGADYGRKDQAKCVHGRPSNQIQNTACSRPNSKVAESCQGKNSCSIPASNSVFGDPCEGTYKYLEVAYACQYPATKDDQI